jgi:hypothetical protein
MPQGAMMGGVGPLGPGGGFGGGPFPGGPFPGGPFPGGMHGGMPGGMGMAGFGMPGGVPMAGNVSAGPVESGLRGQPTASAGTEKGGTRQRPERQARNGAASGRWDARRAGIRLDSRVPCIHFPSLLAAGLLPAALLTPSPARVGSRVPWPYCGRPPAPGHEAGQRLLWAVAGSSGPQRRLRPARAWRTFRGKRGLERRAGYAGFTACNSFKGSRGAAGHAGPARVGAVVQLTARRARLFGTNNLLSSALPLSCDSQHLVQPHGCSSTSAHRRVCRRNVDRQSQGRATLIQ